ncbi:MAG: phosphoribosylaminoimidazolesuccinocarboxamide synthase [Rickettsiales bacterium]|jgi:phosphoribosylaminoimidazole-succinocarboxamide synthase|nr:phosphoribosylaminoimidazolesuccinocarboxamide synthase [Rickettsiales bacterium]
MRAQIEPVKTRLPYIYNGKVRDTMRLPDGLLAIVASDRISAFDHILPDGIPGKGIVLTQTSNWWMKRLERLAPNHLVQALDSEKSPEGLTGPIFKKSDMPDLRYRTIIVRELTMLPIEFIVRGNLTGNGWKDYQKTGIVGGHKLPREMQKSQSLPAPILTPSTKAPKGQPDEYITCDQAKEILFTLGYADNVWADCQNYALGLFIAARGIAAERGLVLVDTKFEFGIDQGGRVILGDEILTPDSSRFWDATDFERAFAKGIEPDSFDKQFVRNYLIGLERDGLWSRDDLDGPEPELPDDIVIKTIDKYLACNERITNHGNPIINKMRKEFAREYGA